MKIKFCHCDTTHSLAPDIPGEYNLLDSANSNYANLVDVDVFDIWL